MFEINMDEYLDEEAESLKQAFEIIIRTWSNSNSPTTTTTTTSPPPPTSTRFLGSHNPALVKRNLLASFTDVLLLPVTIVPRTVGAAVGAALTTGGSAAAQGIAMLNPQRWGGGGVRGPSGYSRELGKEDGDVEDTLFEGGDEEDGEDEFVNGKDPIHRKSSPPLSLTKLINPSIFPNPGRPPHHRHLVSKNHEPARTAPIPRRRPRTHPRRPRVAETSRDLRGVSGPLWAAGTRYDRRDLHTSFGGAR